VEDLDQTAFLGHENATVRGELHRGGLGQTGQYRGVLKAGWHCREGRKSPGRGQQDQANRQDEDTGEQRHQP